MEGLGPRLGLLALGLLVAGLMSEAVLRALGPPRDVDERRGLHELRPDRPWLYGMRPGASGRLPISGDVPYQVNADGFRDRLRARPKPEGVFRVLVLGDSVAFGYGVAQQDAFPAVLEARLADGAPGVEVLNLGVSGYNPYTELALFRDVGVTYQPDLVVAQFCINDLNDPTLHFDVQTRMDLSMIPDAAFPDPSRRREPARETPTALRWCRSSSLCSRLDDLRLRWTATEPDEAARRAAAVPIDAEAGPEWRWLEARYRELARAARDAGAGFALLAFPHPGQLARTEADPVQQRLVALGRRNGFATVDPLRAFRAASRRDEKLFLDWWHPTPAGHRLAASELERQLACAGLLPREPTAPCSDARRGLEDDEAAGSAALRGLHHLVAVSR